MEAEETTSTLMSLLPLNLPLLSLILVNFAIATLLLACIKYVHAAVTHVRADEELSVRDNPAFAISMSGVVFGVIIMMTGVMSSEASLDLKLQSTMIAGYGVLGIILLSFSRLIFDKIATPRFSITAEIRKRNTAAAIIDFSNVIASALVVRAVMFWINSYSWSGLCMIIGAFIISQILLTLASLFRLWIYKKRYGSSLQAQLVRGNTAAAWQFGGYRIGVALAITAASELIPYAYEQYLVPMISWVIASIVMIGIVKVVSAITVRIILAGINIHQEVDKEANLAIGVLYGVIYISLGMLMASLMF